MTIRSATLFDVPGLVEMGLDFVEHTSYRAHLTPDPDRVETLMHGLIVSNEAEIYVSDETDGLLSGMVGMIVFDHPMSGERVAAEQFWWVQPFARGSLGVRLLRRAEQWARDAGATRIQMITPIGNEQVARIYEVSGYAPIETMWQRSLT